MVSFSGTGKIEFAEFCGILARVIKDSDPETELTEAFKVRRTCKRLLGQDYVLFYLICMVATASHYNTPVLKERRTNHQMLAS